MTQETRSSILFSELERPALPCPALPHASRGSEPSTPVGEGDLLLFPELTSDFIGAAALSPA